ncbi:MAG: DUF423 domain-containing protein [Gemmatimonadetes bacterium]|nr:DUF423 domain-containing protein [Gemmatimonadota bacterium]
MNDWRAATRLFFIAGAVFALIGVAAGAFGAHFLSARLPVERLGVFETAVRYQMYHALALFAVAWAAQQWPSAPAPIAGWFFISGILIFGGTLYGIAFGGPGWLGAITPLGGASYLAGWSILAWSAIRAGTA